MIREKGGTRIPDKNVSEGHTSSASDEALMLALQRRRSLEALEELYDRHHRTALAVSYRVLGDRSLAEDVVQEAFLAVWRRPDSFRPERGSVRTWLLSIARHRAIDVTRGRSFANERIYLDQVAEPRYPDVWQDVSSRLERSQVRQAVESLPAEQREAVLLAYFGGQTHREISEQTGAPLGTVKGRMRLAMQKLKDSLTDMVAGETD